MKRLAPLLPGLIVAGLGLLVPSAAWVAALRTVPAGLEEPLMSGAALFRASLFVLGLAWMASTFYPATPRREVSDLPRPSVRDRWILAAILAVAAAVRFPALGVGPWFDEIVTHVLYGGGTPGEIVSTYDSQNQHFLYTLAARTALTLFGDGAAALRLPAVLFGVGSLWALARLARELGHAREGLLAAALLALSYHHVWFSQNARGYTGLMFWTLLSSWFLLRGLARGGRRWWLGYAIATVLGCYTHMTMIFSVAGQLVVYAHHVLSRRAPAAQRLEGLAFGFVPAGLLTIVCYAWVLPQMFGGTLEQGGSVEQWKNPLWAFLEFLRGLRIGLTGSVLAAGAAIVFGAGSVRLWRDRSPLLALFVIPVVAGAATVIGTGHHLWPRFFFFAAGFGALIAVIGTFELGHAAARITAGASARGAVVGTSFSLFLIAASAFTVPRAWAPKQDFQGAIDFVQRTRRAGEPVVTVGLAILPYRDYFRTDWTPAPTLEDLERIRRAGRSTWVVYTLAPHLESFHPEIFATLRDHCPVAAEFPGTLGGGAVFVCRMEGSETARVEQVRVEAGPAPHGESGLGWAPA